MEPNLYHQAQTKFQHSDFEAALQSCNQALLETNLTTELSKQIKHLEADCLLELKQARLAADLYEQLQCYSQAGFAAILSQDMKRARVLYKQAPDSPPTKWGEFLLEFLNHASNRRYSFAHDIPSPGYLTFRLYFEVSFTYFLHYKLHNYIQRFLDRRNQLIEVYPEILKDMGSAHLARQEYRQALKYLTEAANHYFDDAGIHFKSAMAHMGLKHKDEARNSLMIVRKMLPGNELVEQLLRQVS